MKKFAAWRSLLKEGKAGPVPSKAGAFPMWKGIAAFYAAAVGLAPVHAAPASEPVVIANADDAQAFQDTTPFVFAGQPLAVHHSFSTEREFVLTGQAEILVGAGSHFTLNGSMSSQTGPMDARLEKRGLGALELNGSNTYTGNTVLREGVLKVSGASPLGSSAYSFEQYQGTVLELAADTQLFNMLQVMASRAGDVPLPGVENEAQWRVESGTAALRHDANVLGPVRKTGEGSLRIARTVQSHSTFWVGEGALIVDGGVTGLVNVDAGARLEGRGAMAGMRVRSGGMVAPGGRYAAAKLESWRDISFEPGSLFHVNAYPDGAADLLNVGGAATLDGRVWAEAAAGEWAPESRYRILATTDGLGGTTFAGADANLAFLTPALEYDANNVYLSLSRNDLGVGDVSDTPGDKDVGDVIDPPDSPEPTDPTEPPLPDPGGPPTTPSPEAPGPNDPPGPLPEAPGPSDPAGNDPDGPAPSDPPGDDPDGTEPPDPDRDPEMPDRETPDPETPDAPDAGGPDKAPINILPADTDTVATIPLQQAVLGMSRDDARTALRELSGSWHASVRSFLLEDSRYVREAVLAGMADHDTPVSTVRRRTWAHSYAAMGKRSSVGDVAGDRHDSRGLVLGSDVPAGERWRLGAVFAAQQTQMKRDANEARADIDTVHAGLAAHGRWSNMRLTAALLHAWHRIDSRRHPSARALGTVLGASYTGRSFQAVVEVAPLARSMGPFLRHAWVHLKMPAFDESGGLGAHAVESASSTMNETMLGWRLHYHHGGAWPLDIDAEVAWRRVLGSPYVESTQRFGPGYAAAPPSRAFTSQGLPLARNAFALGVGVSAAPIRNLRVSARYSGLYGSGVRSHAAWADLRWAF